ncbi:MAG TPA: 3-oxoacyl-[acyl-carrier-protein] synthase III C-terminal domain-containing protein [Mycobacterium sp.]|uniref:3-oxoacyl-ACP synthase III family protein n=1 Tax=Mycobacterium sp. TaxID=1785 RepID=UPI002C176E4F|nr:3-oxoacyl-[acyl-carrier-protein] synthase III C-terminal domain-containing protein [Mycobacterium sp.]HME74987.1 3-oxoacyl-[acyl-carrier-protein] synthase III C-terminal domain-containing protein [Mycobacterium sp.]
MYLSRPAVVLPDAAFDNEAVLSRVRESFRGSASEWDSIQQSIRYVFDRCNSKMRYLDEDPALSPGEFASRAASACLQENGVAATDIDLLIYGGIARDAFEPATAAEVAGRLGAKPLHAMDVTCACAGLIEALHVAAGYFALHDDIQTALICAGELTRDRITHDIQSLEDVAVGVAGLTLGNAAAALVISREPLPAGSARLVGILHKTLSEHYALCRAPVDGHFTSHSKELFALSVHVQPELRRLLADAGWSPEDVDHYAFHQPSEAVLEQVLSELGARPQAGIHTHSLFGNTASTSWALALDYRLKTGTVRAGDKIVVGSAAAGFTIVAAAAVWEG